MAAIFTLGPLQKIPNPLVKAILNLHIGEPMFYWRAGFSWAEIAYK